MFAAQNAEASDAKIASWQALIDKTQRALDHIYDMYRTALSQSKLMPDITLPEGKKYSLPKGKTVDVFLEEIRLNKYVLLDFFYTQQLKKDLTEFVSLDDLDQYYQSEAAKTRERIKQYCLQHMRTFCLDYAVSQDCLIDHIIKYETYQQIIRVYHLLSRRMFLLRWFKSATANDSGDDAGAFEQTIACLQTTLEMREQALRDITQKHYQNRAKGLSSLVYIFGRVLYDKYHVLIPSYQPSFAAPSELSLKSERLMRILSGLPSATIINELIKKVEAARTAGDHESLVKAKREARNLDKAIRQVEEAAARFLIECIRDEENIINELLIEQETTLSFEQGVRDNQRIYEIARHIQKMKLPHFCGAPVTALDEIDTEIGRLSFLFSTQISGSRTWIEAGADIKNHSTALVASHKNFIESYDSQVPALNKVNDMLADVRAKQGEVDSTRMQLAASVQKVTTAHTSFSKEIAKVKSTLRDIQRVNIPSKPESLFKRYWWKVGLGLIAGAAIGFCAPWLLGLGLIIAGGIAIAGAIGGGAIALGVSAGVDECTLPNEDNSLPSDLPSDDEVSSDEEYNIPTPFADQVIDSIETPVVSHEAPIVTQQQSQTSLPSLSDHPAALFRSTQQPADQTPEPKPSNYKTLFASFIPTGF